MTSVLRLLGGVSIESEAGPLTGGIAQRRRLAVLALLAVSPSGAMSRDRVATFLSPDADATRAHKSLADALHAIRKALGKDAVIAAGDELRLDPEVVRTDIAELRLALAEGSIERAVALYRGPLFDGFAVPGAPELERWMETERQRVAGEYARGLAAAAQRSETAGDLGGAVDWWRRLAAHDPYDSAVAVRLMRALAASGNSAAAVRHAAVHTAVLRVELDATPSSELTALAEVLRRDGHVGRTERVPTNVGETGRIALTGATRGSDRPPLPAGLGTHADERLPSLRSPTAAPRRSAARIGLPLLVAAFGAATLVHQFAPALGIAGRPASRAAGERAPRDRVIVAEFENMSRDVDLAGGLTDALRIELGQSSRVRVVEAAEVRRALARMGNPRARLTPETAREVAIRDGIKAVVTGGVARAGAGYLISCRLIAAESGDALLALRESARDTTELLAAIERVSRRLRTEIGEPLHAVRASAPLAAVTTPSLDALRKFSRAGRAAFVEGDHEKAVLLLEEALALDTTFAAAHTMLFSVLRMRGLLGGEGDMMRRVESLTKAYQHRGRLTERERYVIEAIYFSDVRADPNRAVAAMRAGVDAHPDEPLLVGLLGMYSANIGDFARAESLMLRAMELNSGSTDAAGLNNLAAIQTHLAKYDEAEAVWRRLAESFPDQHVIVAHGSSLTAIARGDYDRAERWLRDRRAARPRDLALQQATTKRLAALATMRGRLAEAARYWAEVRRISVPPTAASELQVAIELARQDALLRDARPGAAARLDAVLARVALDSIATMDRPYLELALLYAHAGRLGRAKSLLAAFERQVPRELRAGQNAAAWVRLDALTSGIIALEEGRPLRAIDDLRAADQGPLSSPMLPPLGLAFERAGQPDSAIATYERYLHPMHRVMISVDATWLAMVHRRLAALYDRMGRPTEATAHYARFVELWKDADPDLQPYVRKARTRMIELQRRQG